MLSFIRFKSKEFISLISLYSVKSESKRHLSQLQTKINTDYIEYGIHERIHREEKELNRILPAVIWNDGSNQWYKNDKIHRDDLDENGKVLPAVIWNDGVKEWWVNGMKQNKEL